MNNPTRGGDIGDEGGAGTGPTVLSYHGAGLRLKATESHTKHTACVRTNNLYTTTMGDNTTQGLGSVEGAGAELGGSGKHGSTSLSGSLGGLGQNTMSVFAGSSTTLTRNLGKSSAADSTDVPGMLQPVKCGFHVWFPFANMTKSLMTKSLTQSKRVWPLEVS
jgi:hypothetical protein